MFKVVFVLAALLIFLSACSENKPVKAPEPVIKTVEYPEGIKADLERFPDMLSFEMDSAALERLEKTDYESKSSLTIEQVKLLSTKMIRDELTQPNYYYLNDYYKIQNHKLHGTFEKFKDSLDIGMTQDANCYPIGKLVYGDSMAILVWQLNYTSYPACPAFSGKHVFGTLVYHGEVKRCMQLAAIESAMDPPVSAETYQTFSFKSRDVIERVYQTLVMEEDQIIEQNQRVYLNRISTAGYVKL